MRQFLEATVTGVVRSAGAADESQFAFAHNGGAVGDGDKADCCFDSRSIVKIIVRLT